MPRWLVRLHRFLLPDNPETGWIPYLWLVYLFFFGFQYLFRAPTPAEAAAAAATVAVFLVLYFNAYWKRGWALLPNIVGMVVIMTAWAPTNVGASVFSIYAASFCGWLGPARRGGLAIAAIVAWTLLVAFAWQQHPVFWTTSILFVPLIGMVNLYYAGVTRRDAAVRLSQEEVRQLAQVAERERISRDLHDLLGHTLSVITLKAELAARLLPHDAGRATAEIREVERISRSALAEVREAVGGIRARGLAGELEHAQLALRAAGVAPAVDGEPPATSATNEAVLAMIVREAVTNVIRHADAQNCRISVHTDDGGCTVEVRDDGRGGARVAGGGIDGMRARIAAAGGRLDVADEYGTRVRAWLPL